MATNDSVGHVNNVSTSEHCNDMTQIAVTLTYKLTYLSLYQTARRLRYVSNG